MTTTEQQPGGDTPLRNVRVGDDLWFRTKDAAAQAVPKTDMSKIARDAWQAFLDHQRDPVWREAARLAAARGTTVDAVQQRLLEQWVSRQQRAEAKKVQ